MAAPAIRLRISGRGRIIREAAARIRMERLIPSGMYICRASIQAPTVSSEPKRHMMTAAAPGPLARQHRKNSRAVPASTKGYWMDMGFPQNRHFPPRNRKDRTGTMSNG